MGKRDHFDDQQWIEAVKRGGRAREIAMKELYQKYLKSGLSYLIKLGGSEEQARDLFQDSVVQLMVSIEEGKFKGQSSLQTYLFAIGKNLWYNRLRRRDVEHRYREGINLKEEQILEITPELSLMNRHQRDLVKNILGQLGDVCREVLTLWSMKYDMREIADQLGYANDQVARNKKSKCLRSLKELVRQRPTLRNLVQELVN